MATKLSRYCDGLMEAGWLAAVLIAPLFFNSFSSRIFEPDKITLLRSLALLILGAWIVKVLSQGGFEWKLWPKNTAWLPFLLRTPLLLPVIFITFTYLVATIFSIVPRTSIWGSYQRLQGTYTTLSYILIFAAIIGNLRRRVQVERIITTLIITSLPISLYGILQRYGLDPIPWGGSVTQRIVSSMGNSIFIAAYLIMVIPLTIGRIVQATRAILRAETGLVLFAAQAALYVFIAALQVIALYMSGSRGPTLGWMAGVFFILLMLTVRWLPRWVTLALVGGALGVAVFLVVFNLEGGPFEKLRTSPAIGRFGLLLNAESNSALVRRYIWEGARDLVSPHPPLEFPDGRQDPFNSLRLLVGYGPESMFVANNPFYIPALGQVEKRNATPDRAHNETWDSLVITGGLGLIAYLWLFTSIFYYGFKWMGLVDSISKKRLFFILYALGGISGGIFFGIWRGVEYLGVGIPFGIVLGLIAYVIVAALLTGAPGGRNSGEVGEIETVRFLTLLVLLAAVLSHFIEINFGIAIAVTRLYFWVFSGLLLLAGYILPRAGEYGLAGSSVAEASQPGNATTDNAKNAPGISAQAGRETYKKKRRADKADSVRKVAGLPSWLNPTLVWTFLTGMMLVTLGFDLITNPGGEETAATVLLKSTTYLRDDRSYGILALFIVSWLFVSLLFSLDVWQPAWDETANRIQGGWKAWLACLGVILGGSLGIGLIYWVWHSGALAAISRSAPADVAQLMEQVGRYADVLSRYYLYCALLIFGGAFFLPAAWPVPARRQSWIAAAAGVLLLLGVGYAVSVTNLQVIQADITYKLGEAFNRPGSYPVAITIYKRANELAPNEDYYYLFLARAYLELAREISDPVEQDQLFAQAAADLSKAQVLNPLNTDHTANLARLYSRWGLYKTDAQQRQELGQRSDGYFARALVLSPNNVRLWNEWAFLALQLLQQPEQAESRLMRALEIDPSFDWTYGQLGDLAAAQASKIKDPLEKQGWLEKAVSEYQRSLALPGETRLKYTYNLALAGVLRQLERFADAILAYENALLVDPSAPGAWRVEEELADLYAQTGDRQRALEHANKALAGAPESELARLRTFIEKIEAETPFSPQP